MLFKDNPGLGTLAGQASRQAGYIYSLFTRANTKVPIKLVGQNVSGVYPFSVSSAS
jgi:hypothetical protein